MSPTPDADNRPRASVIGSIVQGWSRALHAPWVAAGALAVGFLLHAIDPRSGQYVFEGRLLTLMTSEVHEIGALFYLLFRSIGGGIDRPLFAFAAIVVGIWTFLAGGILDRLARARRVGAGLFFWACGRHVGQFVRLGLLAGVAYWALSRWLYPQLQIGFGSPQADLLFLVIVGVADVFFLFAAVRVVVEDRRSVLAALAASWRFIRRRLVRVTLLMLINGAIMSGLVAAVMAASSSAAGFGVPLFLLGRLWARLALIGSAMAFFQNELAHAHYTAAPVPTWPDSPAVEAIENLTRRNRA